MRNWFCARSSAGSGLFCLYSEFTEIRSNLYPPGKLAGYRDPEIRIPVFHAPLFHLVPISGLNECSSLIPSLT